MWLPTMVLQPWRQWILTLKTVVVIPEDSLGHSYGACVDIHHPLPAPHCSCTSFFPSEVDYLSGETR